MASFKSINQLKSMQDGQMQIISSPTSPPPPTIQALPPQTVASSVGSQAHLTNSLCAPNLGGHLLSHQKYKSNYEYLIAKSQQEQMSSSSVAAASNLASLQPQTQVR